MKKATIIGEGSNYDTNSDIEVNIISIIGSNREEKNVVRIS